jgi:hypothetical protein
VGNPGTSGYFVVSCMVLRWGLRSGSKSMPLTVVNKLGNSCSYCRCGELTSTLFASSRDVFYIATVGISESAPWPLRRRCIHRCTNSPFHRVLVDDVLIDTRRTERRSRLLPSRVVVYYVLALCLRRSDAETGQRTAVPRHGPTTGTFRQTSAISQARQRLGEEPLQELSDRVAVPVAVPGTPGQAEGV